MNQSIVLNNQNWLVPQSDIDRYIAQVRRIPILDAEEEKNLARAFFEKQSLEAAQKLIVHHLKFVVHIARGFSGYGLPLADLIQEGNIGLMKAVKRFNPAHGVRLISFAVHWIKSEIHEFIIKNWRMVKIATTKSQRKLFFNLRSLKKSTGWINEEEAKTIAKELKVETKDVFEMEKRIWGQDVNFDPMEAEEDEDFTPSEWLTDNSKNPELLVAKEQEKKTSQNKLNKGLALLDDRSRDILEQRYLIEDGKATLQSLADKYQVSAERIRQIEQQALLKLKSTMERQ